MTLSELKRLKALEEENARLKRIVAQQALDIELLREINSLRGACLVQGALVAYLLHKRFPYITITESHPKALLYLMGIASKKMNPLNVSLEDLSEYIDCDQSCDEHERDFYLHSSYLTRVKHIRKHYFIVSILSYFN